MEVFYVKKLATIFAITVVSLSLLNVKVNAQNISKPQVNLQEQNTMSVLWFQKAGESKALYYQGYNIGKMRLDDILSKNIKKKGFKPAVILDIDETIVDSSPLYAWNIHTGKASPWEKWIEKAKAKALPGAVEFLKYADSKGVEIYYISNRKEAQKEETIRNLKQIGAPQVDAEHVLLQQPGERGKETRRQSVATTHKIVLLFGDNLGDFNGFDDLSVSGRILEVDRRRDEFGKKLIIFPNPMYGNWEEAIYNYSSSKSDAEKEKLRKESLEKFHP
ncbi:5'-nucleotidase, lipoprotein e(P4) family [Neobacillus sp. PS3-40]|uniref:5'-nucleotidase, lipoprotein e(P4) family n=1 Tax=Neobacillus sp. PS3-40 TaxID=3070679 RepID=UPI0035A92AD9